MRGMFKLGERGKKVYRYIAKNLTYITPCKNKNSKNSIDMEYILF